MKTYSYPIIKLPFIDKNKNKDKSKDKNKKENDRYYFKSLFDAILNVDKSYITYKDNISNESGEEQEHLERVFAYELYHQWSKILENKGIKREGNIVLNGELSKRGTIKIPDNENRNSKKQTVYPDLVLHSSQDNDNNQKMICEIKREKNIQSNAISIDLLKLISYTSDYHLNGYRPFKYGIFILVGESASLDFIKNRINRNVKIIVKEETDIDITFSHENLRQIICIAYNGDNKLEYDTLENIIASNNK